MSTDPKSEIIRDAVRRFQDLPCLTIAKYVMHTHGPLFDNDLEKIRHRIRNVIGKNGEYMRGQVTDKTLYRPESEQVKMPLTWKKTRTPHKLAPGLYLILSDIHIPFHDPRAVESAVKYGQAEKVNGIIFNGDLQDCASVGFWPTVHRDTNAEIDATIDFLDFMRQQFPEAPMIYKPGNHEQRLPSLYLARVPQLADTPYLAMETVLGLEGRGIEFLDYLQPIHAGKLPIFHGHELPRVDLSVNPARGLFLKTMSYAACGHCHTTSQHTARNVHGEILTTWSFGCLCDLSPDYRSVGNNWNHGFALVHVESNGQFEIVNRRILPNGKVV